MLITIKPDDTYILIDSNKKKPIANTVFIFPSDYIKSAIKSKLTESTNNKFKCPITQITGRVICFKTSIDKGNISYISDFRACKNSNSRISSLFNSFIYFAVYFV